MNQYNSKLGRTAQRMRENRLVIDPRRLFIRIALVTFVLIGMVVWKDQYSNLYPTLTLLGIYYALEFAKLALYRRVRQKTMVSLDDIKVESSNK